MQRVRHVAFQGNLSIATSRTELIISEEFMKLRNQENFLQLDTGNNNQRILIFETNHSLDILEGATHWYCDRTFKATTTLFDQLFIIQGQFRETILPLAYVIMPSGSESTYTRLLDALLTLRPNIAPISIITDFEHASLNAFSAAFPGARQRGCFFHYSQCVWRHIQQHPSIAEEYRDNADFALHLKMLSSQQTRSQQDTTT